MYCIIVYNIHETMQLMIHNKCKKRISFMTFFLLLIFYYNNLKFGKFVRSQFFSSQNQSNHMLGKQGEGSQIQNFISMVVNIFQNLICIKGNKNLKRFTSLMAEIIIVIKKYNNTKSLLFVPNILYICIVCISQQWLKEHKLYPRWYNIE